MTIAPPIDRALAAPPVRRTSPGWVPAALVAVTAVATLLAYDVSVRDLAAFCAYLTLGIGLPGTLLWRALRGGARSLAEDVAAGLALGYAVELLVYIPARAAGLPLLVMVWPAATIFAFVTVPSLRGHWRGSGVRVPTWWAWALSGVSGWMILWSATSFYRGHGLSGAGSASPYVDMPYHLSLIGELRHHVPPTVPQVLGERLSYHWFVYSEMAATSWATGIEPLTLLYRLSMLPMIIAMVVLVALTAVRISGRWWAGPVAVGIAYFLGSPVLYTGVARVFSSGNLFTAWLSPTQTLGALLFAPLVLLLAEALRSPVRRGDWVALAILLLALTGAKATFLPLLLAALIPVAALWAWQRREWHRATLTAAGLTFAALLFAQFVIFGGDSQGTRVDPLSISRWNWSKIADLSDHGALKASLAFLIVPGLIQLLCAAFVWAGLGGLAVRRILLIDPAVVLLLGIGAAGIGATLMLGHPGLSEMYFLHSARPYLSVGAACGIVALAGHRRVGWATLAGAACVGVGVAMSVKTLLGPHLPLGRGELATVALPYLVLLGVAGLALACSRWVAPLAVLALVTGFLLPTTFHDRIAPVFAAARPQPPELPSGAMEAGRWLRDHSDPGDVVATNDHCHPPSRRVCDSRSFWVAGYTERRVLVEGWGYAGSTLDRSEPFGASPEHLPYVDQERLRANDEVFAVPTISDVETLKRKYGVKWLLAVNSSPELNRFATLSYTSGDCAVYQLH